MIKKNLIRVPKHKLAEVNDFIEFILLKHQNQPKKIIKFEGIGEGLGFEKINNLEAEIRQIRKDSTEALQKRVEKWNI